MAGTWLVLVAVIIQVLLAALGVFAYSGFFFWHAQPGRHPRRALSRAEAGEPEEPLGRGRAQVRIDSEAAPIVWPNRL